MNEGTTPLSPQRHWVGFGDRRVRYPRLATQMASVVCMIVWFKPCSAASAGHSLHSVGFDAHFASTATAPITSAELGEVLGRGFSTHRQPRGPARLSRLLGDRPASSRVRQ
jgi:hypothetical protein